MIRTRLVTSIAGKPQPVSYISKHGSCRTNFPHGQRQLLQSLAAANGCQSSFSTVSKSHRQAVWEFPHRPMIRWLSTEIRAQTAAAAAANASMAAEASGTATSGGAAKKSEPNLFLDNLGKIFLLGIGSVILTLVRSSYNTSNRNVIRDQLEEIAALDPKEIEDFREANAELTLDTMRKILAIYYQEHANLNGEAGYTSSYDGFIATVRGIMASKFPNEGVAFTIQLGHNLDRVVVAILEDRGSASDELPVALLFTGMAMAMNGTVSDRIQILHEILSVEEGYLQRQAGLGMDAESSISSSISSSNNNNNERNSIPFERVRDMAGYLQETYQLPPDTQIVPTEQKYPTQQWRRATPLDMVPDLPEGSDVSKSNDVDLVEFAALLRTKSVCAWGECYQKYKYDASEFFEPQEDPVADANVNAFMP